eukprot:gene1861-27095_t
MPHPFHVENTSTINRLVKVLSPEHLKVLKARFMEADGRKLDREQFHEAVHSALLQWATRQAERDQAGGAGRCGRSVIMEEEGKRTEDKAWEYIARDFGHERQFQRSLYNLFDQLDGDGDDRVDWLDVSNFIVEATTTKQTIKSFNDRPEVREWEGIGSLPAAEVDRLVYIEKWKKIVLCTQHRVVPVFTPPNAQHPSGALWAEFVGHKSSVMNAAFIQYTPGGGREPVGRLATSSSDSTIIIWDERQQCILKQIPFPQPVWCMASARLSDRDFLYTDSPPFRGSGGTAVAVAGATGASTHPSTIRGYDIDALLNHDDWVTDLLVIPDLRLLCSSSLDKTVRVWGDIDQRVSDL